jgi:hypothetical protein
MAVEIADQTWHSVGIFHLDSLSGRVRKSKSILRDGRGILLWHQTFVHSGWVNATHGPSCGVAIVKQPRLIKSWKIASNSNCVFAIDLDCMGTQNAGWIRMDSIDYAGQGI